MSPISKKTATASFIEPSGDGTTTAPPDQEALGQRADTRISDCGRAPSAAVLRGHERVSILDVVSADLPDALTAGHTGRTTLAELAASNLFVQAVGTGGQWYRLHRLIADVLRARITRPRTFRDLHRRAAEWYPQQAMPLHAVRYALRGGLWPLAAELVGGHLLLHRGHRIRGRTLEIDNLLSAAPRDALLSLWVPRTRHLMRPARIRG